MKPVRSSAPRSSPSKPKAASPLRRPSAPAPRDGASRERAPEPGRSSSYSRDADSRGAGPRSAPREGASPGYGGSNSQPRGAGSRSRDTDGARAPSRDASPGYGGSNSQPRGSRPRDADAPRDASPGYGGSNSQPRGSRPRDAEAAPRDASPGYGGSNSQPRGAKTYRNPGAAPQERDSADGAVRAPEAPRPPHVRAHPTATRIEQIRNALGEILQWAGPADLTLSRFFRDNPKLGMRDRGAVAEAVYDVLRHLRRYRQVAEGGRGAATRRLAILGLSSVIGPDQVRPILAEDESDWLGRVLTISPASLPREVRLSVPDWLSEALAAEPDSESMLMALNRAAPLDIRINPMKVDRETILAELQAGVDDAQIEPTPFSPFGIRLQGRPALNQWSRFADGSIEVQDEGSQLLALLVAPRRGEMVIDFCAGAGGKTLLLGALMRSSGRLYALDVSQARLTRFKPRMARSGLSNVVPIVINNENDPRVKRLAKKAHRVLVDAPCSGTGTLRRNPDLKWRQTPESVAELCVMQSSILAAASRCVAPGGRLVYATCSILRVENEDQAEAFLAANPDFELLSAAEILEDRAPGLNLTGPYLKLRTDVHGTDGFFAAVFQRKAKAVVPKADAEGAIEAATEAEADALPAQGAEASEPEVAVAEESPVLRDDSEVQPG